MDELQKQLSTGKRVPVLQSLENSQENNRGRVLI